MLWIWESLLCTMITVKESFSPHYNFSWVICMQCTGINYVLKSVGMPLSLSWTCTSLNKKLCNYWTVTPCLWRFCIVLLLLFKSLKDTKYKFISFIFISICWLNKTTIFIIAFHTCMPYSLIIFILPCVIFKVMPC